MGLKPNFNNKKINLTMMVGRNLIFEQNKRDGRERQTGFGTVATVTLIELVLNQICHRES